MMIINKHQGYNRIINSFPEPYIKTATSYHQNNFSKETLDLIKYDTTIPFVNVCKTIFIGDVSVGKTTLVNRFCYNSFSDNYKATIGVDFEIENFRVLDRPFNLQIWDTAGQERFRCIAQAYYRNANVIVIVFDMTKIDTLYSASTWLKDALSVNSTKPLLFLVGTKCDLLSKEDFERIELDASEVANNLKAEYWSVSAMTGYNILEFFQRMVALSFDIMTIQSLIETQLPTETRSNILTLDEPEKDLKKKSKCTACELI